ncbi:MAG: T9SS type A sorting domain-containing protein, partial [Bacteroidetes bacterium]|nr:T9SS type A sorting domain-containing protein [Bacteroidota bacterium]
EGSCPNQYTVTRTWSVSDDCGNSASHTQVIEVVDNTAPEFTFVPSDYTAECDEELVFDDASATDNCGSVTVTVDEVTNETECAQEYSIVRTFTATDACGNSSTATQTITVQDTTAPVITNAGGLMNGETVEVCCEAPDGTITIPAAVDVTFTDNCDADATQTYTETCVGDNCPTETVDSWCDITTPEVMPDGETCDNYAPHSLRLFNFAGAEFYTTVEGRVANNSDGTKTYTMTVVASDNANAGWTITNHYGAPMTWQEWIDQPGNQSYKSDCGIGDHTTWMYTTLTSGSAEGWGDYAGSSLSFSHQPASGYFGFQIGEGANNKNGNYGFSAWMYYNGTFDGSAVAGSGDVFGDLDCCLPYDLEREYVMTDCAGNTTTFHYTVSMTGEGCSDEGDAGISDEEDAVLTVAKDLIKIESLQPNPTSADAVLMLSTEEESITAQVVVLTMSGAQVLDVYNGPIVAGWNMQIDIPSTQLQSGMYQVQVRAKQFVTTKKLLVTN